MRSTGPSAAWIEGELNGSGRNREMGRESTAASPNVEPRNSRTALLRQAGCPAGVISVTGERRRATMQPPLLSSCGRQTDRFSIELSASGPRSLYRVPRNLPQAIADPRYSSPGAKTAQLIGERRTLMESPCLGAGAPWVPMLGVALRDPAPWNERVRPIRPRVVPRLPAGSRALSRLIRFCLLPPLLALCVLAFGAALQVSFGASASKFVHRYTDLALPKAP